MKQVLLATNNEGKAREFGLLMGSKDWEFTTPAQQGIEVEVDETGQSFEENAVLKAKAYTQASNLITIADDSGLEVDALGGEPGILSARYAGKGASDEDRMTLLLSKLADVPWERRQARFRCVIAIASPDGEMVLCKAECTGMIAFEPKGEHGFGYDPIFYLPELGKTMAELTTDEKNRISHRAIAARQAEVFLSVRLGGF